jgi:hypothetical protein
MPNFMGCKENIFVVKSEWIEGFKIAVNPANNKGEFRRIEFVSQSSKNIR